MGLRTGRLPLVMAALVLIVGLPVVQPASGAGLIPNSSFEQGANEQGSTAPAGWTLSGGRGSWADTGATGHHSISVSGSGDDENDWTTPADHLKPGQRYRIRFFARREGGGGGSAIAGPVSNNRDFNVGTRWSEQTFVFRVPSDGAGPIRFGQWHTSGTLFFDDISIHPVTPVYARRGAITLGDGENIRGDRYTAQSDLGGDGSNDARYLLSNTAAFNSNRWLLNTGSSVLYHHAIPGATQISAQVAVQVNYHVSGVCVVEARVGGNWTHLGALDSVGAKTFDLPSSFFPAAAIETRLRAAPGPDGRAPELQVDSYRYAAILDHKLPALSGRTWYAEQERDDAPDIAVTNWGSLQPGANTAAILRIGPQPAVIHWAITDPAGHTTTGVRRIAATPGSRSVRLPYTIREAGPGTLQIDVSRGNGGISTTEALAILPSHPLTIPAPGPPSSVLRPSSSHEVFAMSVPFQVSALAAADYGYPAMVEGRQPAGAAVWWCEGAYKIGRSRPAPAGKSTEIHLSAAGGEEEPVQLVLRPDQNLTGVTAAISSLHGPDGAVMPSSAWRILHVDYVPVARPSDATGAAGDWPDPLPPYSGPFTAAAGENTPLWLSVRVPPRSVPGDYRGLITVRTGDREWRLPIRLHVWAFTLPAIPHLRSGMGISPDLIREYHNLKTDAQLRQVWDLYMRDFAAHRLTPYNAMELDPIKVSFTGSGTDERVVVDTADFDRAAHRYLDEFGFTGFRLPVEGMGGGTFYSRKEGTFAGYQAGTPEYNRLWGDYVRQLQDHLKAKGWLSKTYVYWFDEPSTQDFPFVREGMDRLKQAAPGLTRLLTKEPEPGLIGSVNLWCPILNAYNPAKAAERQRAGEEVWWYICTGPKAPYPGEFIDRSAVDMRAWVWDTWLDKVQGLLIWETTYWTSPTAYPDALQDPWTDPMSWEQGYGAKPGAHNPWGNGDGRFLYPPIAAERAAGRPIISGPIDSLRWEMFRDGLEDYEYFHILQDRIAAARQRGAASSKLAAAEALLTIPPSVLTGITSYSTDPQPMYAHRARLAEAIEALK